MLVHARWALGLVVILVSLPSAQPASSAADDPQPCAEPRHLAGAGIVCDRADGLLDVYAADGRFVGIIHGLDPKPSHWGEAEGQPRAPNCVDGAAGTYYIQVLYARAFDDVDGYAFWLPRIHNMVDEANGHFHDAGVATGAGLDLNVKCVGGVVDVPNLVLRTPKTVAEFATIVLELQALGYTDPHAKYWIFYDDPGACTCGGLGNIESDARLKEDNRNNGKAAPMFAADFGYDSTRIMLHELGHTMGAVQNSAPRTTGAHHCTDGNDIMCYNDGGPQAWKYTRAACILEVWDCNRDDYFHAAPAAGTYLAGNWNTASPLNRFITPEDRARPRMAYVDCPPWTGAGGTLRCLVRAHDDSAGVAFNIDWGDGSTSRVPATGFLAPGQDHEVLHPYATTGTFTIVATAQDDGAPSQTSLATGDVVQVLTDGTPPTLSLLAPLNDTLYVGCEVRVRNQVEDTPPQYRQTGCIWANANDAQSSISSVEAFYDGGSLGALTAGPYQWEFPAGPVRSGVPVLVVATDLAGNTASQAIEVDVVG